MEGDLGLDHKKAEFYDLPNFLFDLNPILPQHKEDIDIDELFNQVSSSYGLVSRDVVLQKQSDLHQNSLTLNDTYLTGLTSFEQDEFEEDFQKQRDRVFLAGMEGIMRANKKGLLNGFDL